MKKIFALLLCLLMTLSLVACDGDENSDAGNSSAGSIAPSTSHDESNLYESTSDESAADESIANESTANESTEDGTESSESVAEDTIRPNGELPKNKKDLTRAEMNHYIGKVMQAIITLDVETMKEYANENSERMIRSVKEDDTYRLVWEKTIGKSIYLEESHRLVYKDPNFIFASWLTDVYKNGETLRARTKDYSEEEIIAILDKYIDSAPYVTDDLDIEDNFDIDIEEGKIIIDCRDCFNETPWYSLNDVSVPHPISRDSEDLARLAFGEICEVALGFDYIKNHNFTIWEAFVTADLDTIAAAFDKAPYGMNAEITDETNQLYERVYQTYYKDDERRAKIQKWMDENVIILRDLSSVFFYIPAEMTKTYPYYTFTDAEKEQIKDMNLYICPTVHSLQSDRIDEFNPFFEIIEQMVTFGELEWLF